MILAYGFDAILAAFKRGFMHPLNGVPDDLAYSDVASYPDGAIQQGNTVCNKGCFLVYDDFFSCERIIFDQPYILSIVNLALEVCSQQDIIYFFG